MRERAGGRKGAVEVRVGCRTATRGAKKKSDRALGALAALTPQPARRASLSLARSQSWARQARVVGGGGGASARSRSGGLNKDASNLRTVIEKNAAAHP